MVELLPEERIIKKICISRIAWLKYYVLIVIIALLAVYTSIGLLGAGTFYFQLSLSLVCISIITVLEVRRVYTKYIITNKRVIKDSGLLKNEVTAWEIGNIVNIRVHERLFGRVLGYGTLDILLVDNNKMLLDHVRFPQKTMEVITELVEGYKK